MNGLMPGWTARWAVFLLTSLASTLSLLVACAIFVLISTESILADQVIDNLRSASPPLRYQSLNELAARSPAAEATLPQVILLARQDPDERVRAQACSALGEIASMASDDIIETLHAGARSSNIGVQDLCIRALVRLGPDGDKHLLPAAEVLLRQYLTDTDTFRRESALQFLAGKQENELPGRVERNGKGANDPETVRRLIDILLNDKTQDSPRYAAVALGRAQTDYNEAMRGLLEYIKIPKEKANYETRGAAAKSLPILTGKASSKPNNLELRGILNDALRVLENDSDGDVNAQAEEIRRWRTMLDNNKIGQIISYLISHPYIIYVFFFLGAYAACIFLVIGAYCFAPASLLVLQRLFFGHAGRRWSGPIQRMLLLPALCERTRVLDAWVSQRLATAVRRLEENPVMQEHTTRVSLPACIDGNLVQGFACTALRPVFNRTHAYILICGEGGIGKTSLACEIARSAVGPDPENRPASHPMLPLILDSDLAAGDSGDRRALLVAIGRKLQLLLDLVQEIPEDFLSSLLRTRRILVIVDRFSELNPTTRKLIQPSTPGFPINALIITSRLKEALGLPTTMITLSSISKERLSIFAHDYLTSIGERQNLTDEAFWESIARFSSVLALSEVTVLLAKLFFDQVVAIIRQEGSLAELPSSVPELMLHYINLVNRPIVEDRIPDHRLHQDLKAFAWECLRNRLSPSSAKISHLQRALGGDDADRRLAYLDTRLSLATVVDPPGDEMRLRLDPLAEMLAALYFCDDGADGKERADWFALFDTIRGFGREGAAHSGFVCALREVTSTFGERDGLQPFIGEYLHFLADALIAATAEATPNPEEALRAETGPAATLETPDLGSQRTSIPRTFKRLRPRLPRHKQQSTDEDVELIRSSPIDQDSFAHSTTAETPILHK